MGNIRKRLTIELDEQIFYAIKEYCVKCKITVREYLTQIIETEMKKIK